MKKLLLVATILATSAFSATAGENNQPPQSGATAAQQQTSTSQAANSGVTQNITFAAADNTTAARAAGDASIAAASIAAQGQRDAARESANGTTTIKNTPAVFGPNLTSSNDTCMGSTSGSVNGPGIGVGFGTTWVDENCKRLKNSRELWNMGMKGASLALMCKDDEVRDALEVTGFVCPTKKQAESQPVPVVN